MPPSEVPLESSNRMGRTDLILTEGTAPTWANPYTTLDSYSLVHDGAGGVFRIERSGSAEREIYRSPSVYQAELLTTQVVGRMKKEQLIYGYKPTNNATDDSSEIECTRPGQ